MLLRRNREGAGRKALTAVYQKSRREGAGFAVCSTSDDQPVAARFEKSPRQYERSTAPNPAVMAMNDAPAANDLMSAPTSGIHENAAAMTHSPRYAIAPVANARSIAPRGVSSRDLPPVIAAPVSSRTAMKPNIAMPTSMSM